MDYTVCCPAPVSNSQSVPILWSVAATRLRRRPTARDEPGGRCGRRDSTAVDIQMGSTDDLQHLVSKRLPPLTFHGVWPVAADVTEHFQRASLFSSQGQCRLTLDCCYSTRQVNYLKMSKSYF